ncbi:acetoin utilization protein AcuC [Staphylococcus massiliensis]|uniref:acetoin utilization protein AcuC n=1 Tax=Staphylococcus massiliensis TaxID=555791 RepID=UPI001EDED0A1|nr:acetoin utilization protein AcuC [Staphylococcus massiliensis]
MDRNLTINKTGYVYATSLLQYRFHDKHPFNQMRLKLTTELLLETGHLNTSHIITPRIATDDELALIHKYDYIEAIKRGSRGILAFDEAEKYGLGSDDTSQFKDMHEHSARIVGGALSLVDAIMNGEIKNGCHLGGGLHHSLPGRANGFCIYNDIAVAAKYLETKFSQRVLVIDTDAHHGDGTQWSFYTDEKVLNYSIHETGKFLFPGSGHYTERGKDKGFGYSINLPLEPYTEDESFMEVFKSTLHNVAASFKPDIILSVHGSDIHYSDPLTHLHCTLDTLYHIPYVIKELADTYTDGKVIMFGGGGYNIWRVVPRTWSHVFLSLIDEPIQHGLLPPRWVHKWHHYCKTDMPTVWEDERLDYHEIPRKHIISEKNRKTASTINSWFV